MAHSRSLWGRFRRITLATLAVTLITPGSSYALDFSNSRAWALQPTYGDFYNDGSFWVSTDNNAVDSNSPANGTWGWGDSRSCNGFGCGGIDEHLTTVRRIDAAGWNGFDFLKVTILENPGGITFTGEGGLYATFAAGDIGLKTLNWNRISIVQIHNLAIPSGLQGSSNIDFAYIDNLDVRGVVPEPSTYALMFAGLGLAVFFVRRQKK